MVKHSKLLNKQTGDAYVKPEDAALTLFPLLIQNANLNHLM